MSCKIAHFLRVIFGRLFTEFADFEMERFRIPSAETRNGPRNSDLKNPIPGDNSLLKMMFFQRVLCGFQVIFAKYRGDVALRWSYFAAEAWWHVTFLPAPPPPPPPFTPPPF